jgi:pimeloyl-ACP methyl ester carboxylesterase
MNILFLPGLICDDAIWAEQARDLGDIATITIADLTMDDSVAAMARRALAAAADRFALVALSMGGYVAFEILRQAPGRVTALALFDTSAAPDSPERAERRRASLDSLAFGRFAGVTNRMLPDLVHASLVGGPVGTAVKEMAARVGRDAFIRQQLAILNRTDSRPLLERIKVPTLVAVGDADVLTPPAEALAIHIGVRTSRFQLVRDCGHLPPMEQPEAVTALLREFLALA